MDARANCERLSDRVHECIADLSAFARIVQESPAEALLGIPPRWPSQEELRRLLSEIAEAWEQTNDAWNAMLADKQRGLPSPLRGLKQ